MLAGGVCGVCGLFGDDYFKKNFTSKKELRETLIARLTSHKKIYTQSKTVILHFNGFGTRNKDKLESG